MATRTTKPIIAIAAPVTITAAETEGEKRGPAAFTATFYTGGKLDIEGFDLPVVIDLAELGRGNVLVANQYHDSKRPVGNFDVANDGKTLVAHGTATAATEARDEVVNSAVNGYQWQASLEVNQRKAIAISAGKTVKVNGQELEGPFYRIIGTLKGFAFVSHGADDNTTVAIAASAASTKGKAMKAEVQAWVEEMLPSVNVAELSAEEVANLEANFAGKNGKKPKVEASSNPFEARKLEAKRRNDIREIADKFIERRDGDLEFIEAVEKMVDHAIEAKMSSQEFRLEMYETSVPMAHTVPSPRHREKAVNGDIITAALCQSGRLSDIEKHFDDKTLQAAHSAFKDGISLNQLFILAAESNGYRGSTGGKVTLEVQRAAFGLSSPRQIQAQGWSTIDIATIVSNTANKFLRDGWNTVDMSPMKLASVRSVNNFHQITTVSLTGALQFEKVGPAGEIKHGTLDELTYTNQIDTYARMLAITRQDMINDDLGALTAVPRRLGRGGALKLNDIFWTEFLNNGSFFTAGNNNVNTGVADMTVGGLAATEAIFLAQTDPDGLPLGLEPRILVVPTALKAAALTLMESQTLIDGTGTATQGSANIWRGRFDVVTSPYISNSAYTGYSASAWYMLASPSDMPVIEIAALNGRVEPTIDNADTDFNTLGVQFRGYSDVGVNLQEFRGGVRADGGSS